ncbi:hypothetical protein HYU11_02935 [Candidatus Woesearchaeota archaeon]|nr:hypothetical protein [Candidatus Woesearchaeota archaeon]
MCQYTTGPIPADKTPIDAAVTISEKRPIKTKTALTLAAIGLILAIIAAPFSIGVSVSILVGIFQFFYPWLAEKIKLLDNFTLAKMGFDFFTPIIIFISYIFGPWIGIASIIILNISRGLAGQDLDPMAVVEKDAVHAAIAIITWAMHDIWNFNLFITGFAMTIARFLYQIAINVVNGSLVNYVVNIHGLRTEIMNLSISLIIFRMIGFIGP